MFIILPRSIPLCAPFSFYKPRFGLHWVFLVVRGLSPVTVCGLLITGASLVELEL